MRTWLAGLSVAGLSVAGLFVASGCSSSTPKAAEGVGSVPLVSAAPPTASAQGLAGPRSGRLVLALVVDQLALWEVLERVPALPESGGFRRLLASASRAEELRYGHVQTSTAIGHATLFTGLDPVDSRITSNVVVDGRDKMRAIVGDPGHPLVGSAGSLGRGGVSLAALAPDRETFGDALKRQRPDVTLACISMKDRGAIFACGRHPDAVYWFDTKSDAFVTSSAFALQFPHWATRFGRAGIGASYRASPWVMADPKWVEARLASESAFADPGDYLGLGRQFPHRFEKPETAAHAMLATPAADRLLTDLALELVGEFDADKTHALAVSFSAHDYVHHVFTATSPEAWDELYVLDQELGRLLDGAEARFPGRVDVVLSADHGGPGGGACDRRFERPCEGVPTVRIDEERLTEIAARVARKVLGPGEWIDGTAEPFVFFSEAKRALSPEKKAAFDSALTAELMKVPGVLRVFTDKPKTCPTDDSQVANVCRSWSDNLNVALVLPSPGAFFETGYVPGDGSNHGTDRLYDRAVPIIVRRAGAAPASAPRFQEGRHVEPGSYVRTLSSLLSIEPPNGPRGSDLSRAD